MSATGDATATAVLEEADSRDFGTSSEDVRAYASAGGAAAGAAACAAVGAAPAAPLCSYLGGWAADFIAGTVVDWCTSDAEAERARERRREVRRLHDRVRQVSAWDALNGAMLSERVDALIDLHSQIWPGVDWIATAPDIAPQQRELYPAILLLAAHGMPTQPRELGGYVHLGTPSLQDQWARLRPEMSDEVLFEMVRDEATGISESIERAYDRAVIELAARGAGDEAEDRARRPQIRTVGPPSRRGSFGTVEPVGPGRVVVPAGRRSLRAAALRAAPFVALAGAVAGVGAWRHRRA